MESKVKSMGHPIHPMLVNFPLGLLITSAAFDIIHLVTGNGYWSGIAFWMITAGIITGLLAAVVGTIDALAIPSGTRAKSVSILHGTGNFLILALFVLRPPRHTCARVPVTHPSFPVAPEGTTGSWWE